ncbi:ABC transporter substrate-binding protein [Paraburkholderia rhizosphaerae]|uniref:NitT/TauT family transport system substrate-binding protein n=1 Tax=Paraburkholderia rhizosphaerae TaxID=480658 RepID=A0A4R8M0Q5_9BURK|nr:ABC transporter substrate-binding protein [Paraburkholderia rhizosphaerae]TDY54680.1 NitT/TauT family transport system substrate-binding protein [Paraburkholderia rhizosphaerae]
MSFRKIAVVLSALAALVVCTVARADMSEIKIARQYGVSYLPLMIMQDQKLLEKHAAQLGVPNLKVSWVEFAGGNVMNDALLSNSLQIASGGVAPLVLLWSRTHGTPLEVKALAAINSMPLLLNTTNPAVKTVKDFSGKDKIALPAAKVSIQAITLQMAAEKAFGSGNQGQLDKYTVSLAHPDAQQALLSGSSEVTAHFGSPPFQEQELSHSNVHTVVNSYDVLGGKSTFNLVWCTSQFYQQNPKLVQAFIAALDEAEASINKDKHAAALAYLRISKDKSSVEDIEKMISSPDVQFTTTPQNTVKYADFMARTGLIKTKPASWKDMFFPTGQSQQGS